MTQFTLGRISGIIMTTVMCGTLAAPAFAQQPTDKGDASRYGQGQDAQSMAQLKQAHSQLQSAALSTLKQQTKEFCSKSRNDSKIGNDPKSGNDRKDNDSKPGVLTDTSADRGNSNNKDVTLDEKELLIAACPHGLLAGAAASGFSSTERSQNRPGSTNDREQNDRERNAAKVSLGTDMASDETVGMILIYTDKSGQSTGSSQRGAEDAAGRLSSGLGDTSTANKSLKPGVYAVKSSGNSVTLTDESGRTVLRTTIDQQFASNRANRASNRSNATTGQPESDRSKGREAGTDQMRSGEDKQSWEAIFGAITAEVMNSMGWSSNGTVAASGR